jgi:hypothetical protein
MYMSDLCRLVESVPGLRLANNAWMNKQIRDAKFSVPQVAVYYGDKCIKKVDQSFMDERPHYEDWHSGDELPWNPNYRYAQAYHREAWPLVMKVIEDKIPEQYRSALRKKAKRMGFEWWRR